MNILELFKKMNNKNKIIFITFVILFIILLIFFIYEITNKEELIDSVPTLEELIDSVPTLEERTPTLEKSTPISSKKPEVSNTPTYNNNWNMPEYVPGKSNPKYHYDWDIPKTPPDFTIPKPMPQKPPDFTIPKIPPNNNQDIWFFIKGQNLNINVDPNGNEYIECNILINNPHDGKYDYIGIYDIMRSHEKIQYSRLPPMLLPTSIKNLEDIQNLEEEDIKYTFIPVNLNFRITYIPGRGYKIFSIAKPYIVNPTLFYQKGFLIEPGPTDKLQDISKYLININYLKMNDRDEGMKELNKEKPTLFWEFEKTINGGLYIKSKNKTLHVFEDAVGLDNSNVIQSEIKLQPTFPSKLRNPNPEFLDALYK